MSALKKIFALKNNSPEVVKTIVEEDTKKIKLTFFESGYGDFFTLREELLGHQPDFCACIEDVLLRGTGLRNVLLTVILKPEVLETLGSSEEFRLGDDGLVQDEL